MHATLTIIHYAILGLALLRSGLLFSITCHSQPNAAGIRTRMIFIAVLASIDSAQRFCLWIPMLLGALPVEWRRSWCWHRHRLWLSNSLGVSQSITFEATLWLRHLRLCPLGGDGPLCPLGGILNPLCPSRLRDGLHGLGALGSHRHLLPGALATCFQLHRGLYALAKQTLCGVADSSSECLCSALCAFSDSLPLAV